MQATEHITSKYVLSGPYGSGSVSHGLFSADTFADAADTVRADANYWNMFTDTVGLCWRLHPREDVHFDLGLIDGYPLAGWVIGPRGGIRRECV